MRSILDLKRLGADPGEPFPSTSRALEAPNGLLAWGGDLRPERLLNAYRHGIFPWYSEGQPILWWSPAPRCVIYPQDVYLSRRTRRRYNSGRYRLTADTAFPAVVAGCARRHDRASGTWITRDMAQAYHRLHQLGHAHSLEVWSDQDLVGGIYGLAMGSVFYGESMFSRQNDASKIALIALCRQLDAWGFGLMDCQVGNPHLFTMGAVEISREAFEAELGRLLRLGPKPGAWTSRVAFEPRW